MKKIIALALLCLSANVFAADTNATQESPLSDKMIIAQSDSKSASPLASEKVDAYDAALDAPLLKKLKKGKPLTMKDKARLEIIYQTKYAGEEELNATQKQIYAYAKKMLSKKTRALLEKRADSQGM